MQKRSNDCANEVTKNIRSSKNYRNKSSIDIKGSIPIQDINTSLDERSDDNVNITNKETGGMLKIIKKESKRKYKL